MRINKSTLRLYMYTVALFLASCSIGIGTERTTTSTERTLMFLINTQGFGISYKSNELGDGKRVLDHLIDFTDGCDVDWFEEKEYLDSIGLRCNFLK